MESPILSIVIANYNYGRFLEDAIQSVITQKMDDKVELIIIDAASTDNSVEIIKKYTNGLPPNIHYYEWKINQENATQISQLITWWCSEKDKGQSDAFNKGFSHARGKYLTWLNADDILISGCLKKLILEFKKHPDCEWFTGNMVRYLADGRISNVYWGPNWYPYLLQTTHSPVATFGPTSFFSKRLYDFYGGCNNDFHYIMDSDLWSRFIAGRVKQRRLRFYCWGFRMHEDSKTAEFNEHNVDDIVKMKIQAEKEISIARSGYSCWKICSCIFYFWRIFDGSFIKLMLLRRKLLNKDISIISKI